MFFEILIAIALGTTAGIFTGSYYMDFLLEALSIVLNYKCITKYIN